MTDSSPQARIDAALARIDAAVAARGREAESLRRRHAALKNAMADAVKAIDGVIAQEDAA